MSKLNDKKISNAKPTDKTYQLSDGLGLSFLITPKNQRGWRFRYTFDGKAKMISLGTYPDTSLSDAREECTKARKQVAQGIDPSAVRKAEKEKKKSKIEIEDNTFEKIVNNYLKKRSDLNESYHSKLTNTFKRNVFPFIGKKPITDVLPKDIIEIVKRVEERGAIESAHRLFTQISKVFKYAVSHQKAERNPCMDMDKKEILQSHEKKNYPTITDPKEIGILLNLIDSYSGDYTTKMALSLAPYVFLRPYNLRHAEWCEIDFDDKIWRISKSKMKTKNEHLIPLSETALNIFREMKKFSGDGKYVFPSYRNKNSPMSDNTMNTALKRLGYTKNEIVPHGFRAMFSTIAHEKSGFKHEVIETQLAHSVGSKSSQSYNRALYLDERKELMKWWSDFLDNARGETHV